MITFTRENNPFEALLNSWKFWNISSKNRLKAQESKYRFRSKIRAKRGNTQLHKTEGVHKNLMRYNKRRSHHKNAFITSDPRYANAKESE